MGRNEISTTYEERLFIASLQEKEQNCSIREEDLAYALDYFLFKNTVAERCCNIPPHFWHNAGTVGEKIDKNMKEEGKAYIFLKELEFLFRSATEMEKRRLSQFENYVIGSFFGDYGDYYVFAAKALRRLMYYRAGGRTRTYRSRVFAGHSVDIEYRMCGSRSDVRNNIIHGIQAFIRVGEARISLSELSTDIAAMKKFPEITDGIMAILQKHLPGVEAIAEQINIPAMQINAADISYTTETETEGATKGRKRVVSITCPEKMVEFIADEMLMSLTSTFLGRNYAYAAIEDILKKQFPAAPEKEETGCGR